MNRASPFRFAVAVSGVVLQGLLLKAPAGPVVYSQDFEDGIPDKWEGAYELKDGLPAGSRGAAAATPGEDIKSAPAWIDGHFTVADGMTFNYWVRMDNPQWYQVFMFCKARGPEAKDMVLYEAKPDVGAQSTAGWRLVSIPFGDFHATMGTDKGSAPKPGSVCWSFFWSFQKRDLGFAIDKVWITKGSPDGGQPPDAAAPPPEDTPPQTPTWAFLPPKDAFSPDALLDLRTLNETRAGDSGFVRQSPDGNDFVLGDGRPARFWAVVTSAYRKHPRLGQPDLARHARFLAKRGINMVRFHGNITPREGQALTDIDTDERDNLWRTVAAMKAEGIYTTFSPYWAVSSRVKPSMGVPEADKGGNAGLLFFDNTLQDAFKMWMRKVLTETNPYTGIPLAQDPALAIIQLQNEDSLLFWTSQGIGGEAGAELRRKFARFLDGKYGSLDKAREAWGGDTEKTDNFAAGEAGLYIIWFLTQEQKNPGRRARLADQMQFLTETMRDFNAMMGAYLRDELGCKQLVNAGNWRTADNVHMLDAERYSYCANEVMAVNRYYTSVHEGKNSGWAIVTGDRFTDDSVLTRPRHFPLTLKQVVGHPMIVPESSWVPPLGYQSEGPFLVAAYQSLTGIDAYYWFATGDEDWRQPSSANGYMPSVGKWVCHTPMLMGQWPAAALLYRKGYVKEASPVVLEQRPLDALWQRETPLVAEDPGFDPNRDAGTTAAMGRASTAVDPLAYLAGPVCARYDAPAAGTRVTSLTRCIDNDTRTVHAVTGELTWDYGRGLCLLDAPKAQGATGFLKACGDVKLRDVTLHSTNAYATVLVVAMDDRPLADSRRILVQVGTTERPTGWKTRPTKLKADGVTRDGEMVTAFGKAPWQIVRAAVTLSVRNPHVRTMHVLDANGMETAAEALKRSDGAAAVTFPEDALYAVLTE